MTATRRKGRTVLVNAPAGKKAETQAKRKSTDPGSSKETVSVNLAEEEELDLSVAGVLLS